MSISALPLSQRADAVITHAETLAASMRLLEEGRNSGQPRDVVNKLARRVQESIAQIDNTLGPITQQINLILGSNQ